jgi:surfeit locus 1 family protein
MRPALSFEALAKGNRMLRRLIFPLLLGAAGIGVLCSLGIWQIQRMEMKRGYLAEIESKIAANPVPLPVQPDPEADRYLPVFIEGQFTGESLEVLSSTKLGGVGVRVIGVFAAEGRRILIDRGYLPEDARKTQRTVTAARVEGNLQWPQDSNQFTPPPDTKTGLWYARDVVAMSQVLNTEPVLIIARAPTGDGIEAMPVNTSGIPNDHWGYAITWFLLALVWAGMTVGLLWRMTRRAV